MPTLNGVPVKPKVGNNTLSRPGFRDIVFPYESFRAGQKENVIGLSNFLSNNGKKVLMFRGSTGIGKTPTALAAALHTIFDDRYPVEGRIFYVSTTKNLQEQAVEVAQAFSEANPDLNIVVYHLRGRANYPCLKEADKNANECVSTASAPCIYKPRNVDGIPNVGNYVVCRNGTVKQSSGEMCEYFGRKFDIIPRKKNNLEIVVMTTQYLITEGLFAEEINPADIIVFDEGRHLESQLVTATALNIDDGTLHYIFGSDYQINCNVKDYSEVKLFLKELVYLLGIRMEELDSDFKVAKSKKDTFAVTNKKRIVARLIETIRYLQRNWNVDNIVIDTYIKEVFKRESKFLRVRFVDVSKPFNSLLTGMTTENGALCMMSATMQSEAYIKETFKIRYPSLYFDVNSGWDKTNRPVVLIT